VKVKFFVVPTACFQTLKSALVTVTECALTHMNKDIQQSQRMSKIISKNQ
jgi:hypothetical protein